jgi:hypothetical protein
MKFRSMPTSVDLGGTTLAVQTGIWIDPSSRDGSGEVSYVLKRGSDAIVPEGTRVGWVEFCILSDLGHDSLI